MPFKQFKTLTFDVVGTLIDFEAGILAHVREVAGVRSHCEKAARNQSGSSVSAAQMQG